MTNPYQPPSTTEAPKGSFGDLSILHKKGFLYRKIELIHPFRAMFVYNGWNFMQRIIISDQVVWKRISWIVIHRHATFQIPEAIDPQARMGEMRIVFSQGAFISQFSIIIGGLLVYDEWN